jgi:2-hydroxy-3-oxopropionate reductase
MTKDGLKVGFVGLGIMGAPMALTCSRPGMRCSWPARQDPGGLRGSRRQACAPTPPRWRKAADIIITMVPDTPHVD